MFTDCIYFEETYKEIPKFRHCTYRRSLFEKGVEDNSMCHNCRLWDAYIPKTATEEEKKTAQAWQNMSFDEQPDYHDYFSLHGMETL